MAVIEGAGLEPSETNLHQLNDIFSDFRTRASLAEGYATQAQASANAAAASAQGVVTQTAEKIEEINAAGSAQVILITNKGTEVGADIEAGIAQLQTKLQELIGNLETVGGQEASAVRQQAQEILDDITATKALVLDAQSKAASSETAAASSAAQAQEAAQEAQTSATQAASSATNAKTSEDAAAVSERKQVRPRHRQWQHPQVRLRQAQRRRNPRMLQRLPRAGLRKRMEKCPMKTSRQSITRIWQSLKKPM